MIQHARWLALSLLLVSCGGGSVRLTPSYVAVHNTMSAMGLVQSGEISEGSLAEGGVARVTSHLRAGDCYTIVAFGSEGVRDLDVVVMDDTGTEVAADRTNDAQAAAQLCPEAEGDYQIAVRMAQGNGGYVVTSWSGMPRGGAGAGPVAGGGGAGGRGTCSSPLPLAIGTPVRGSTTGGASTMTGTCIRGGEAPERVYQLTVERRAQVSVTINSDYDGALYLLGSCGEMRSEIACNDDDPNTTRSHIDTTLDAGTYFVVVDGYATESGEFELIAQTQDLQSLAQVCGAATPLRPGVAVTGSTAGQPNYFTATCAGGAGSPDRVYAMDVPTRSRMRLRMQSTYDGALHVRSDCANPSSEIACNDDHQDTRHSMVVSTLDPGRYYIFADGFSTSEQGDYSMRADLAPVAGGTAPADRCAAAGTVTAGQDVELDTFAAADDYQASCGGAGAPDTVYRLEVRERSRLRATLQQSEFPAVLYLQSTCGQQASEVACAAIGAGGQTELDTNVQPGTYFLVVDGAAQDNFGAARLEVQLENLQALETACRSAPRLRPGRTVTGDTGTSSDRFQATCAGNAQSNDLVYRLQLTRRSRVVITSEQQYDGALYIRRDCTDVTTEVACNDDEGDNRHSRVETTLDAGTYYVFVDGFANNSQGSFTLDVEVSRAQ
ncbi:MAG: pre-peptidase C-terminal domain-containing protein [Sandaracinaceae bacterium]